MFEKYKKHEITKSEFESFLKQIDKDLEKSINIKNNLNKQ